MSISRPKVMASLPCGLLLSIRSSMLKGKRFLVIEDETLLRKSLVAFLEQAGAEATPAANLAEALRLKQADLFDCVLLDVNLPDGNGIQFLRKEGFPETTAVVVMTAEGGIRTAVEAIRNGAADYLSKPFELDALPVVFGRVLQERSRKRIHQYSEESGPAADSALFTGKRLEALRAQMERILTTDKRLGERLPPVLIEGETGTGKSTLARWLHAQGPRAANPLVEVNASTLPDALAESELFGHERGAFTDARKERIGLFEAADGGTLFIDEISSLSPAIQAKILTVIEDGQIRRLGGNHSHQVDSRLIAASLHPLQKLVAEGSFREDLYHRLHLLYLRIPPLREFPEDIPEMVDHLLDGLRRRYRLPDAMISPAGLQRLCSHPWPGNVRELIHELERALVYYDGQPLDFAHLAEAANPSGLLAGGTTSLLNPAWRLPAEEDKFAFEDALKDLSQSVIQRALDSCEGNVSAAARRLGVPRDFVRYRVSS